MNVKEILEAKHMSHSKWEMFKREFLSKPYPEEAKRFVKTVEPLFDELLLSFVFWHDMAIDYMDEQPDDYSPEDRTPEKLADQWVDGVLSAPDNLDQELSAFRHFKNAIPDEHLSTIVLSIGRWVRKHASESWMTEVS